MKGKNINAILHTEKKAPYLTFPPLSKIHGIIHGFSTKLGGVSDGNFSTMNLGYNRGDDKAKVDMNYKIISQSIGIPCEDIVTTEQIHETVVKLVTKEDKGKGITRERDYHGVDGLITNIPNIPLVTYYADCVPLYFIDTKNHAIGLSHSGWRGTVKKMGHVTIQAMKENFNTNVLDLVVLIGPSICQDCYEVSYDVYSEFSKVFPSVQLENIFKPKKNEKYVLDLWEANRQILLDAGVADKNIHCSNVCTCCNSDILFSHRIHGDKRGTLGAFLMIE